MANQYVRPSVREWDETEALPAPPTLRSAQQLRLPSIAAGNSAPSGVSRVAGVCDGVGDEVAGGAGEAVGEDDHRGAAAARGVLDGDAGVVLVDGGDARASGHGGHRQCLKQRLLQVGAVYSDQRCAKSDGVVSGVGSREPTSAAATESAGAGPRDAIGEGDTKEVQGANGIRPQCDASAHRLQRLSLFEHLHLPTGQPQRASGAQTTDPGADDQRGTQGTGVRAPDLC